MSDRNTSKPAGACLIMSCALAKKSAIKRKEIKYWNFFMIEPGCDVLNLSSIFRNQKPDEFDK